jgi:3-methyladenine DNA glycosylase AlkD
MPTAAGKQPPPPTADFVLAALRAAGKPHTAEIYRRHGATGEVWGVSFADLAALAKKLKTNHPIARVLWSTGVVDAQTLALMVADPAALTPATADAWLRESRAPVLLQYLARLVAKTSFARDTTNAWTKSTAETTRAAGYTLLATLAPAPDLSDDDVAAHLAAIEKTIPHSPDRARYAMNGALIAIGVARPALRGAALAAARRIGKVEVDHGDTGCKTPDAESYILKAAARKQTAKPRARRKA